MVVTILVLLSIRGLMFCNQIFDQFDEDRRRVVELPPLSHLAPSFISVVLLGHDRIYKNFLAIWTSQILLNQELGPEDADALADYVVEISKHKPMAHMTIYVGTCFALMKKLKRPDLCHKVLEAGIEAIPDNWEIPFTLAFVEGFVLKNFERSSYYYYVASTKKWAPDFVRNMVSKHADGAAAPTEQEYLNSLNTMLNQPKGKKFLDFVRDAIKETPHE